MPKSRLRKKAAAKRKQKNETKARAGTVRAKDLAKMINDLETYEGLLTEDLLEIDGEIYMTPEQAKLLEQLAEENNIESEENKDAG